ncbi:MAG: GNAT family N-acetyltransferase [Candidatus Pedobacter colombiensis]|uniref:GNAT family N-acetyltransferase n=1 Tax=Candidatus Pedobacter colombiensis TaxID=3121371 RepID=A0AAJ6B8E2_9SPHI|nr:GNAT family N-acetyltransferase [Pedobacter sp.]WEK20416.1 MAG: GNAT family N-acetyltransferase [Pedobacter sp.]
MGIRKARTTDVAKIGELLSQLGYPTDRVALGCKLNYLSQDTDHLCLVYEQDGVVLAFIAVCFVPQMAVSNDLALIGYFAVEQQARRKGIGKQLEAYCEQLARERNCNCIQVHCNSKRIDAHRFYERQGYQESPKYFSKKLF